MYTMVCQIFFQTLMIHQTYVCKRPQWNSKFMLSMPGESILVFQQVKFVFSYSHALLNQKIQSKKKL